MEIGQQIREARKKKGLTQVVVAQRAKIAINSLRLYEAGKRQPHLEQIRRIALAIGVTVSDLVGSDFWSTLPESEKKAALTVNPYKDLINSLFDQLNDEGQSKAVERVEELTEIPKYKKEPPQD